MGSVANDLARSYLSDRFQVVTIESTKSNPAKIVVGGYRTSYLPPFFIIFINDRQ